MGLAQAAEQAKTPPEVYVVYGEEQGSKLQMPVFNHPILGRVQADGVLRKGSDYLSGMADYQPTLTYQIQYDRGKGEIRFVYARPEPGEKKAGPLQRVEIYERGTDGSFILAETLNPEQVKKLNQQAGEMRMPKPQALPSATSPTLQAPAAQALPALPNGPALFIPLSRDPKMKVPVYDDPALGKVKVGAPSQDFIDGNYVLRYPLSYEKQPGTAVRELHVELRAAPNGNLTGYQARLVQPAARSDGTFTYQTVSTYPHDAIAALYEKIIQNIKPQVAVQTSPAPTAPGTTTSLGAAPAAAAPVSASPAARPDPAAEAKKQELARRQEAWRGLADQFGTAVFARYYPSNPWIVRGSYRFADDSGIPVTVHPMHGFFSPDQGPDSPKCWIDWLQAHKCDTEGWNHNSLSSHDPSVVAAVEALMPELNSPDYGVVCQPVRVVTKCGNRDAEGYIFPGQADENGPRGVYFMDRLCLPGNVSFAYAEAFRQKRIGSKEFFDVDSSQGITARVGQDGYVELKYANGAVEVFHPGWAVYNTMRTHARQREKWDSMFFLNNRRLSDNWDSMSSAPEILRTAREKDETGRYKPVRAWNEMPPKE